MVPCTVPLMNRASCPLTSPLITMDEPIVACSVTGPSDGVSHGFRRFPGFDKLSAIAVPSLRDVDRSPAGGRRLPYPLSAEGGECLGWQGLEPTIRAVERRLF